MKEKIVEFIKNVWTNCHFKFILVALIATLPILVYSDIPISHDILFHLSRIKGIAYEIDCGNFGGFLYHNFLNNLGYASPLFYPDLFLYPFAFLYKVFSLSWVYKILMFFINLITIYIIDFVLHKFTSNKKIIGIGIFLYTFAPYRMVDMYARGCLGESLAFLFLPLIILGLHELVNGNKKKYYYLVIGMTGVIYSHIISTYLVGILIFFYLIFNVKKILKEQRYLYFLWCVFLTFLLTCNFLLPLAEQLIDRDFYIHYLDQVNSYNNIYVPFYKLFLELPLPSNAWFPLGIGVIYLYFIYLGIKYRKKIGYQECVWLVLGVFFLLCSTGLVPRFIYNKFFFLIQYQWRFYMLATISLFFFGIKLMEKINVKETKLISKIVFISSIVVLSIMTTNGAIYKHTKDFDKIYLGFYEYLPDGINVFDVINNNIESSSNNEIDFNYVFDEDRLVLNYTDNNYNDTIITVPLLYYKGYTCDKNCDIINSSGLVGVKLEEIEGEVVIYYEGTDLAYISRSITLITILSLSGYFIRKKGLYDEVKSGV